MMRKLTNSKRKWLALLAVTILLAVGILAFWRLHNHAAKPGDMVGGSGKVVSLEDRRGADGPLSYQIRQSNATTVTVNVSSGFSTCDRTAIVVPRATEEVGAIIHFRGILTIDKLVQVCEAGTYIK